MMNSKLLLLIFLIVGLSEARRDKRQIYVNPTSATTLGFISLIPLSMTLPTLVMDGRALDHVNSLNMTGDIPEELFYDSNYAIPLNKLTTYFAFMEIPNLSCRERLICELAENPLDYSPVSEFFLKDLSQKYGPLNKTDESLMWRYLKAARTGYTSAPGDCEMMFSRCPEPASRLLNMPVLRVWQFLSENLGLKII